MSTFCSFQSRLAPPEHRRWRRCHGLQLPLHPQQLFGWLVLILIGIATFVILLPALQGPPQKCLLIILSVLFAVHIAAHVTALILDPADVDVRAMPRRMVPEFDRTKHGHVIENGRCHLCNIRTRTDRTKHCSVCNKCVDNFDHHCKWLNHCVGGRNYKAFIVCIVSAVLASLTIVATAIAELVFFHVDPMLLHFRTSAPVFLAIVSCLGLLAAAASILLLHLCLFHAYITILGITTYEYIRNYRQGTPVQCTCGDKPPRTLTRQNTDPQFIDRPIKPFVVQLPDEQEHAQQTAHFDTRKIWKLCPRMKLARKINQIRPTNEIEINHTIEKIAQITHDNQPGKLPILPVLLPPPTNLASHLKTLHAVLGEDGVLRTPRRTLKTRPHTPSLSPIRESGLSNPASPRILPNVSKIFLSGPNSPCSSDKDEEEEDDDGEISSSVSTQTLRAEEFLRTPQLPRKVYSPKQPNGWERLGSPRHIVAPMVDASELAWRLLARRHGAQLCYTPMLHSSVFVRDPNYRALGLSSCPEDRPLVVQFSGNNADTLARAATFAEPHADAIDINLGCPQSIARRGRYGAFLQDEWDLLNDIVGKLRATVSIPISCKIRIYPEISKTVEYALMLERAGCNILTVHGRTREQKGPFTGIASWAHISAVKNAVRIPVIANGNIQTLCDITKCIQVTGCNGVMSAEGHLYNPFIFEGVYPPAWVPAEEYLDLVEKYPCPISYTRGHLFKLFQHLLALSDNTNFRNQLAGRCCLTDFRRIVAGLKEKYEPIHNGLVTWTESNSYDLKLPPWLCKPYERPAPSATLVISSVKRPQVDNDNKGGKIKKFQKGPGRSNIALCTASACPNPLGGKCSSQLCKVCCRIRCYKIEADCLGHGILIKTHREKARLLSHLENVKTPSLKNEQ